MTLPEPLLAGKLIRRYKRFLADVELESGETVTVHCANSGSMLGLDLPGSQVLLSRSRNPRRKLPHTLELVKVGGVWVGVNTLVPNRVVHEALSQGKIPELAGYDHLKAEATAAPGVRFDFRLQSETRLCFVEVKSVTLGRGDMALFPDAKTERGRKHLRALVFQKQAGHRAVALFLVNRSDCVRFSPAADIDPEYAGALRLAYETGVELLVYRSQIVPPRIVIGPSLLFEL